MARPSLVEELHAFFEDLDRLVETIKDISLFMITMTGMNVVASVTVMYIVVTYYRANYLIALSTVVSVPVSILLFLYGLLTRRFYRKWKERIGKLRSIEAQMLKDLESIE